MKEKLQAYLDEYLPKASKKKETNFLKKLFMSDSDEFDEMEYYECAEPEHFEFGKAKASYSIASFIQENKEEDTFQTKLFQLIDNKNLKDSDVYNKVNIDRRLFSKIRSNKDYHPSKETILLLGIALELNEEEIEDLLSSASYSLPMNTTYDLIIRFCFKEHIYDLNQINDYLYDYHCKTLSE